MTEIEIKSIATELVVIARVRADADPDDTAEIFRPRRPATRTADTRYLAELNAA